MKATTTLKAAREYLRCGYSVIPVQLNGTKRPIWEWKEYQTHQPTDANLTDWFSNKTPHGIGLVQGAVSGNAEMLECETDAALAELEQAVRDHERTDLLERLNLRVRSGGGGIHIFYRCPDGIAGNTKLARHSDGSVKIETRGEGGQVVAPGSPLAVHKSGKPYELLSGSFADVPVLTAADRAFLFDMARLCNEFEERKVRYHATPSTPRPGGGKRPGDAFNEQATNADVWPILERAGWSIVRDRGDVLYLARPGKDAGDGHSATLGAVAPGVFYCFTTSATPFGGGQGDKPGTAYKPYSVYGLLECGGDFKRAFHEIGAKGYGEYVPQEEFDRQVGERCQQRKAQDVVDQTTRTTTPTEDDYKGRSYKLDDTGNGERLVYRHGHDLRYSPALGWLIWDGKRWAVDQSGEIDRRAKETARSIATVEAKLAAAAEIHDVDSEGKQKKSRQELLAEWSRNSAMGPRRREMVKAAETEPGVFVKIDDLDANPDLLNCLNGTVDLRTGALHNHQRGDLITRLCPVVYDPNAKAPTWEKCLERWHPEEKVRAFLQRAAGYSLTGHTGEETAFFLYGSGRNGKSKFVGALEYVLGEYAARMPLAPLTMQKNERTGATPDIARVRGARLVVAAEMEERVRLKESFVKDITGGDKLTAEEKYKAPFEFKPCLKLWLYGNHKPTITGTDDGIWSRLPLIPFTVTVPPEERDPNLAEKLQAEASGILAWAVRGAVLWREQRLGPPPEVVQASEEYRQEMDVYAYFFKTEVCLGDHRTTWVEASRLRQTFDAWTKNEGIGWTINPNDFGKMLTQRGCKSTTKKVSGRVIRVWLSVGLASERPEEESGNTGNGSNRVSQEIPYRDPYRDFLKNPVTDVTGVTEDDFGEVAL